MKFPYTSKPLCRRRQDAGFALVVALVLLSFILLLLLSLATLTKIETQGAVTSQKMASARQNALLGLELALGELQKHTGPDQRVTAPSSILAATGDDDGATHQHWTGVWRQNPGSSTRAPQLQTWLVSGNENGLNLTPTSTIVDPSGRNSPTVWLVGPGSVQQDEQRIKLPRQPITGHAGATTGHYAWWASDESTKANLALLDPHATAPASERIQSFLVAQRTGMEQIPALGSAYPVNEPRLEQLMSPGDLVLLGEDQATRTRLSDASAQLFHDTTTYSKGLLTDTSRGGLKKDLSSWLRGTTSPNAPSNSDFIVPPTGGDSYGLPRWGLIRSYNALRDQGDPSHHAA